MEEQRAELGLQMARNAQARSWREISALVDRTLAPQSLDGDLDAVPKVDPDALLAALDQQSPDLEQASALVARAELAVKRAEATRIPDLEIRSGLRYNRELLEINRRPVAGSPCHCAPASPPSIATMPIRRKRPSVIAWN